MPKYLSQILQETGTPIDFEFVARSELLTKPKKAGGTYQCYEYTFLTTSDGKIHKENIFQSDYPNSADQILATAEKGDMCRASLNAKGFVDWKILPRGEALLSMSHPPVTASIRAEKAYSANESQRDQEQARKEMRISYSGLVQAHISAGRTNSEAIQLAVEARKLIDQAVERHFSGVQAEVLPSDL